MTCYSPKDMKSFGCDALIPVKDHMILTPACMQERQAARQFWATSLGSSSQSQCIVIHSKETLLHIRYSEFKMFFWRMLVYPCANDGLGKNLCLFHQILRCRNFWQSRLSRCWLAASSLSSPLQSWPKWCIGMPIEHMLKGTFMTRCPMWTISLWKLGLLSAKSHLDLDLSERRSECPVSRVV